MIGRSVKRAVDRVVKTAWKRRMHLIHNRHTDVDRKRIVRPRTLICCSLVLLSCPCGANAVEYDVKRGAPPGWSTADDGSDRCPACAREATNEAP